MPVSSGPLDVGPRSHVVQFYGDTSELAAGVSGYFAQAIASGCVALAVATPDHSRAFAGELAAAGVDVDAAQRSGSLVFLDAAAAVARFTAAGVVDAAAFDAVIGAVIRRAAAAGRPLRVYGEMVALLWDGGHVNAALELEALWNTLGSEVPFSLYCAYPDRAVCGDSHHDALAAVHHVHTAVISLPEQGEPPRLPGGAQQASQTFRPHPGAPRAARRFATEMLEQWGEGPLAEDAALVVTELATNAVVHARSRFTVTLAVSAGSTRIAVADDRPLDRPLLAAPGHGLSVVDAVAAGWGVQPGTGEKTVWAELRRS